LRKNDNRLNQSDTMQPSGWWWNAILWLTHNVLPKIHLLWTRTWRVKYEGVDNLRAASKAGGVYVGIWHCNILITSMFVARHSDFFQNMITLVSPVWEGELIARFLNGLGYRLIRASGRTDRIQGFKQVVRALRKGEIILAALDGPSGPAELVKPGVINVTAMGKATIIPAIASAKHFIHLPTWDKHKLALPFTTVIISIGNPIDLPKRPTQKQVEQFCSEIEKQMTDMEQRVNSQLSKKKDSFFRS